MEVICSIDDADGVMEVIRKCTYTGKIGDGKVWMLDVDRLMRVRTGETGEQAI